ncbi:hypothetical protein [Candidatus Dormiibacter inghamiae]
MEDQLQAELVELRVLPEAPEGFSLQALGAGSTAREKMSKG